VRAESGVEAEKLKSVKELNSSQNPNPSHPEGFGTHASFNCALNKPRCRAEGCATRPCPPPAPGSLTLAAQERNPRLLCSAVGIIRLL
jgi:hypothetical protein